MNLLYYAAGRLLYGLLVLLNSPLNWFDHHFWINVERNPDHGGLGVGSWIGLRLMRWSANLEARGRRGAL